MITTLLSVVVAQDIFNDAPTCSSDGFDLDTDYHNGQGLGSATGASAEECCAQCAQFPGCKYFTYAPSLVGSECWFKDNNGGKRSKKGVISGGVGSAPAPMPTPVPAPVPGPVPVPAPTPSGHFEELKQAFASLKEETCAKALSQVPTISSDAADDFMIAYRNFTGDDATEAPVLSLASKLSEQIDSFLSLADSFESHGLDSLLVKCMVLSESTPEGLAEFAVQGQAQEELVDKLLNDAILMRDMLVAGGAKGGKYGQAMEIYEKLWKSSNVLEVALTPRRMASSGKAFLSSAAPWDDRSQRSILQRLALGTALAHADPYTRKYVGTVVDPVQRYSHYEKAYLAGDLDPAFEALTAFECRYVSDTDAVDDDLAWMRKTLAILRPDYIAKSDMHWRYAEAVHEVAYGHTVWPDGFAPDYKMLPAAGAVCGGRAWFSRLARKSFGMPTWGVQQPGHAAMTTWAPDGWAVLLGADWKFSYWAHQELDANWGGPDFRLETQCREHRLDFQKVLRMQWVATARAEEPVNARWTPTNTGSYGKGGLWSALALYLKKVTMNDKGPAPSRQIGSSVVETKVERFMKKWAQQRPVLPISTSPDGIITIPASAVSCKKKSVDIMWSFDDGQQLLHSGGSVSDPDSVAFEYEVRVDEDSTYFLTANMTTWHMNTDLMLSVNSAEQVDIPMYFTLGYWNETQPVQVELTKGSNLLHFTRRSEHALAIKEFFLFKAEPVIPTPDPHATPAPTPPLSNYIELNQGLTCVSQGIVILDATECQVACEYLGYKYTGVKQRAWLSPGCFALAATSEWPGNCNYNSNSSACDYDPDIRALCLREG